MTKRRLILATIAILFIALSSTTKANSNRASSSGSHLRIGVGYPYQVSLGLDHPLGEHLNIGIEVTSLTQMMGIGGDLNARYHFTSNALRPFIEARCGYGLLGTTLQCNNIYNIFTSCMVGVNYHNLDLAIGLQYDEINNLIPFVGINYSIALRRR